MSGIEEYAGRLTALLNELESTIGSAWIADDIAIKYWRVESGEPSVKTMTLSCVDTGYGVFEWKALELKEFNPKGESHGQAGS